MDAPLHEDLAGLAFLLGTWEGEGAGEYPTIDAFRYGERIEIAHVGDTYLTYLQRSWAPEDGSAIHLERGFIRMGNDGEAELTLAHPLGLVEVAHGVPRSDTVRFTTDDGAMGRTHTGLDVTGVIRRYRVTGEVMSYEVDMSTERTEMTLHLRGELRRLA